MNAPGTTRGALRLASMLLTACTALALANLPANDLPPGWLLAFVLPSAALVPLGHLTPQPWQRALSGLALQTAAFWLAFVYVGPMSRPAALACTILPPLGFATARQAPADQALALFLSFCVLLVGTILDGVCVPLVAAYGICACLSLRCANHLAALARGASARTREAPPRVAGVLAGALPLALGSLFVALAIERTLGWLPSPSRSHDTSSTSDPAASGPGRIGLDDSFRLDGTRGAWPEPADEPLVRVHNADGAPLANDLYLRTGFFTVPGLDRWQLGALDVAPDAGQDQQVLRAPRPGVPLLQIELQRTPNAGNFVFVPPAVCELRGLRGLVVDPAREWIRQRVARDTGPYLASFQALPPITSADAVDSRAGVGLTTLPHDLDTQRYEQLLQEWDVGTDVPAALQRIAAGLARRCRYDRLEPAGPWPDAIDNFLFAPGDRRGYCMHFASAAALLLRLRGVPCRIGVGVHGGEADRDRSGARVFGAQHAHAWVEIPFADRGYVVFDPTPPSERGRHPSARREGDAPAPAPVAGAGSDVLAAALAFVMQPWLLPALLALVVVAATWPRRGPAAPVAARTPVPRGTRRLLARLLQALAAAGHERRRGQTLETFAAALASRQCLLPAVGAAFATYQQVRFGGRPLDAERERTLRAGLAAARGMPRHAGPARDPGTNSR